jgi:uncharacterized iron-regulated membrane protein
MSGPRASAAAQAEAAVAAVPNSNLHYYQLPRTVHSAVQIIVGRGTQEFRVYVNPFTSQVLKVDNEDHRLMSRIFYLHGELLLGDRGSFIVETAASWAIIMILMGLYLWWPRGATQLAGVIYPRMRQGKRIFWRDIHAVTGIWVSLLAMFFLLSGLPWAKSWGTYLEAARRITNKTISSIDWSIGSSSVIAQRLAMDNNALAAGGDAHAQHAGHGSSGMAMQGSFAPLNRMIAPVERLGLAFPVLISPPASPNVPWTAKSDSQDRVLRDQLTLDPGTAVVLTRMNFAQQPLVDRIVGIGVAAHEGHLYGWLNQLVNLMTSLGLMMLSVSAVVLWWRRRPEGVLGAPASLTNTKIAAVFIVFVLMLALYLPLFGLTLLLVIAMERFVLRRLPAAQRWLGLKESEGTVAHIRS